jgi:hypothetical protein
MVEKAVALMKPPKTLSSVAVAFVLVLTASHAIDGLVSLAEHLVWLNLVRH